MASLGDLFGTVQTTSDAVDNANAQIAALQAQLATDETALVMAQKAFGAALVATGVPAVLAPNANPSGSIDVAVAQPDAPNGYVIYVASAASTVVPDIPAPNPTPTPDPTGS